MGWVANILFVLGIYAVGDKRRIGFVLNGIANGLYVVVGISERLPDLATISVVMAALNCWGWFKWGNKSVLQ